MTPKTTVMRKVKRPEGFGRWPAYELSIDDYGIWLFSPKGTIYRGQTGSHVVELEVGQVLTLTTTIDNPARRLYLRHGFVVAGVKTHPRYEAITGIRGRVLMTKELSRHGG